MKKILFLLSIIATLTTACKKDYEKIDKEKIDEYVKAKGLTTQTTSLGVQYIIEREGKGDFLNLNDEVAVKYKGYFLDDKEFDKSDSAVLLLSKVIQGWANGLEKFQVGSKGKLFIPSGLAYGKSGASSGGIQIIPANTVLAFDIEILKKNPIGEKNRKEIKDYIAKKGWKADSLASGLFYIIEEPGTGNNPTVNSTVTVKYKGYTLDDKIFDQTTGTNTATFLLADLIDGWKQGIPLLKKGGKGKFLLPSRLGYYRTGSGSIPPYAPIVFDIELVNFQ
jgi:FKBP-type peptidyl-prolyl cis-trans isomerase FkpA